jgi:integrase
VLYVSRRRRVAHLSLKERRKTDENALLRQGSRSHDGKRNYAIVQFLLQTGLQLDECSQLMLSDISVGERSGRVIVRSGEGNKARSN